MEQLVNFIIRPPRAIYNPNEDLLDEEFIRKGHRFQRKDLEITNNRGNKLQCSHYVPRTIPEGISLPCVIYCHGNSGCRADGSEAALILLPSYITVFTLDFSGSGCSEGEHVTLGWNEKDDLRTVVNYLRANGNVSRIGLWGRSMGAVTSLMYGAEDPSIAGMVLDSPFSNLVDLMMELVDTYKVRLPKFTVKFAIQYMRKIILKKAKFDIMDLNALQVAKCCYVPVLLGHAEDDDFIHPHHSDRIYESYVGDKNIIKFDGDHNSQRPQFYFDSISIFFHNVLNPPSKDLFKDNENKANYLEFLDYDSMRSSEVIGTSSAEDFPDQLFPKRPISRTEVPIHNTLHTRQSPSEREGNEDNSAFSSSGLIDHHPSNLFHGSAIPSTLDDDFVQYASDNLEDFPNTVEDEEQMLMLAIMESLKDFEKKQNGEEILCNEDPSSSDASHKDNFENSNTDNRESPSNPSTSKYHDPASHDELSSSSNQSLEASCSNQIPPHAEMEDNSKTNSDIAGRTRATLTVQKQSTNNILDGLVNRWRQLF